MLNYGGRYIVFMGYSGVLGVAKVVLLVVGVIVGSWFSPAYSHSFGISGHSGNPVTNGGVICVQCHARGFLPRIVLSGPLVVSTGSNHTYTLTLGGLPGTYGGFDVSVSGGRLTAVEPYTQLLDGEVTHLLPRGTADDSVIFSFNWTAPSAPGNVTMYAAGLLAGLNASSFYNVGQTNLTIAVKAATIVTITTTVTSSITVTSVETVSTTFTTTSTFTSVNTSVSEASTVVVYVVAGAVVTAVVLGSAVLLTRRKRRSAG